MVPDFAEDDNLPPGVHPAEWDELVARFGWNPRRLQLLAGLKRALVPLRSAGCRQLYLDGSFVTAKEIPGDYDAAWNPIGVNLLMLRLVEPVFFDFRNKRAAQKAKYGGEFFPSTGDADGCGKTFFDFFQQDKSTGLPKGIVVITP
ncbi:DUF6932 family protein [Fimbriiglobus ruber]|uniref:Uncharacterized protein n=1 Tax=Fimbriiglobus ruber TaxID=1908690 RepID=A0A225D7G0_9BACT|nr:hypothetical protein [Fimbriiglobus ruber]OWK37392.1 hypothetical protein FRUB_06512 [Fimbriiglobus ruber]